MEKIITESRTREVVKHSFYCDHCAKYLGTTEEYDDGWYAELNKFEFSANIDEKYVIEKCLCDECRQTFVTHLKSVLEGIGFKKERYD